MTTYDRAVEKKFATSSKSFMFLLCCDGESRARTFPPTSAEEADCLVSMWFSVGDATRLSVGRAHNVESNAD